jgi:hypothetical protein
LHGRARQSGGWPIKLNDTFIADRATIHFEIEINHGRPAKAPGQPAVGSPPANDLIGEERIEVVDRVDLGRGRISPVCAKCAKAALHLTENESSLLPKPFSTDVTAPYTALLIAALPFGGLAAPGDYDAWRII